jgi:5-methylcytosine-specific restriction protein A
MWDVAIHFLKKSHQLFLCENMWKNGFLASRKFRKIYTKATVVDHIIPHRGNQRLFWDQNNWQALCKRHHDLKTGNEDSRPIYQY